MAYISPVLCGGAGHKAAVHPERGAEGTCGRPWRTGTETGILSFEIIDMPFVANATASSLLLYLRAYMDCYIDSQKHSCP